MNAQPVGYKAKAFGARKLAFLFLVIVLLLPACTRQPGSFGINPDRVARLDEILSRMAADETFSASVLIAQVGEVLLNRGYGSADREQGIPNTPQTRFFVGSVTKQFTAMAILILQSQGRLDLQDPIYHLAFAAQYLGDLSMPLHNTEYNAFNRKNHAAMDGIADAGAQTLSERIRVYDVTVRSDRELAAEVPRVANLSQALGRRLEAGDRLPTPEEALVQFGHSASLLRAVLRYTGAPRLPGAAEGP